MKNDKSIWKERDNPQEKQAKDWSRNFRRETSHMTNKHEKVLNLVIYYGNEIKTTMSYYHSPIRMVLNEHSTQF